MRCPDFARARQVGRSATDRVALHLIAVCAALLLPLIVFVLGLVIHLVLGTAQDRMPGEWIWRPWAPGGSVPWPWFGDPHRCLIALLLIGTALGLLEAGALWLHHRAVQRAALRIVLWFQAEIHRQAYRLGSSDLLGGRRTRPEQLVSQATEVLHQGLIGWWQAVPYSLVSIAALVCIALAVHMWIALVVLLAVVLVRQLDFVLETRGAARRAALDEEVQRARSAFLESLQLTPLATGYALAHTPGRPFHELLDLYRTATLRVAGAHAAQGWIRLTIIVLALAFVLMVLGFSPSVTVAEVGVLATAVLVACCAAWRLRGLRDMVGRADEAAAELFAYLRRVPAVRDLENAVPIDRLMKSIQLEGVTLATSEGAKLLNALDLTIAAGQRVGILATETPAAMALAGLLMRLYDPAAGRVLFDDYDIATATLETVRSQSLWVPANGMLYEGTVQENITCGDARFTLLQITDAAKQARAQSFILDLPHGFVTRIGNHGVRLDAGQAFCIGLARALLRNPSILMIAEPSDDLDRSAQERIDEALRLAATDRTLIVIPARLPTLRILDKVVVLHEGKVHDEGSHRELLRTSRLYRHLNFVRFHAFRGIH
ncbi:MAG: ATP-binding cassette domain-containing protein [Pirellulaceae bacterium]